MLRNLLFKKTSAAVSLVSLLTTMVFSFATVGTAPAVLADSGVSPDSAAVSSDSAPAVTPDAAPAVTPDSTPVVAPDAGTPDTGAPVADAPKAGGGDTGAPGGGGLGGNDGCIVSGYIFNDPLWLADATDKKDTTPDNPQNNTPHAVLNLFSGPDETGTLLGSDDTDGSGKFSFAPIAHIPLNETATLDLDPASIPGLQITTSANSDGNLPATFDCTHDGETFVVNIGVAPAKTTLNVVKVVDNKDAPDADKKKPSDFNFSVSANGGAGVANPDSFQGNATGTLVTLTAGDFTVTETNPDPNFTPTFSGACSSTATPNVGGGTLNAGDNATCTITNTFNQLPPPPPPATGTLTVIKHVVGGGPKSAADFHISVTASGTLVTPIFPGAEDPGTKIDNLEFGTLVVTEDGDPNYTLSHSGNCDSNGQVTLDSTNPDQQCTLINTFNGGSTQQSTGTLTVIKVVDNTGAPTQKQPGDFQIKVTASGSATVALPGDPGSQEVTFQGKDSTGQDVTVTTPGTYQVSELNPGDYVATFSGACAPSGQVDFTTTPELVCTITNTFKAPTTSGGPGPSSDPSTPPPSHGGGGGGGGGCASCGNYGSPSNPGSNPSVNLQSSPNPLCNTDKFTDYKTRVAAWLTCEGIAHGLMDNDKIYSGGYRILGSHFVKLLLRGSRKITAPHKLGSPVSQYVDALINKFGVKADKDNLLNKPITGEEASALVKEVTGVDIKFSHNLTRQEAADKLFDQFAEPEYKKIAK